MTMNKPKCKIIGQSGNAFAIIGAVRNALKDAGQGDKVEEFMQKATAGDYNHLLRTVNDYVEVE